MNRPRGIVPHALCHAWADSKKDAKGFGSIDRHGLAASLCALADEFGCFTGDPEYMAELYGNRKDAGPERWEAIFQELEADGLIKRYWAPYGGKIVRWTQILNWPVLNVPQEDICNLDLPWPPVRKGAQRG